MEDKPKEEKDEDDSVPLEKAVLDQFTADMLHGCLEALTGMPATVFKACDVLSAVAQRNGEEWKENTMMHILQQVQCFNLACNYFLELKRQINNRPSAANGHVVQNQVCWIIIPSLRHQNKGKSSLNG